MRVYLAYGLILLLVLGLGLVIRTGRRRRMRHHPMTRYRIVEAEEAGKSDE